MNPLRIELSGLTNLDVLELQNYCKASGVEIEVNRPTVSAVGSPHRYGELATATVILVLAPAVMKLIALWLAKRGTAESLKEKVTVIGPDGSRSVREISYQRKESEPPEAGILKVLQEGLVIDSSAFGEKKDS